ncbi:MAG: nucleoside phosphorylase [Bacteroidales bacterium]|nr:nucleoside phosphorylase [Bacteroidales bacterium]
MKFQPSELIVNQDGSIFHLKLKPEDIADDIILVGDPGRVDLIATFLDKVEVERQNREFKTITGTYNNKRVSILSSGIGTDNIDIVINELDALKNIDLATKQVKKQLQSLRLIRLGTSGALQEDIPSGSFVMTSRSIGFDNLMQFYNIPRPESSLKMEQQLKEHLGWPPASSYPYVVDASKKMISQIDNKGFIPGTTISAPGFYGPQGRQLRIPLADEHLNNKIRNFRFHNLRITNYEMESSAIYALASSLGHEAVTVCAIIANRLRGDHLSDYQPKIKELVKTILDKI